jgi:hypothetical protein
MEENWGYLSLFNAYLMLIDGRELGLFELI